VQGDVSDDCRGKGKAFSKELEAEDAYSEPGQKKGTSLGEPRGVRGKGGKWCSSGEKKKRGAAFYGGDAKKAKKNKGTIHRPGFAYEKGHEGGGGSNVQKINNQERGT